MASGCCQYIVHPESFRSNTQNANTFRRRNRPRVKRNGAFICVRVRLRLRSFASTVRDRPRALTCVRTHLRTYIYTQLGPGLVPDPAVPLRRAGSSPIASSVPSPIGVPLARLRHQPGSHALRAVPPVEISSTPCSESPLARSTSYASLDRLFA